MKVNRSKTRRRNVTHHHIHVPMSNDKRRDAAIVGTKSSDGTRETVASIVVGKMGEVIATPRVSGLCKRSRQRIKQAAIKHAQSFHMSPRVRLLPYGGDECLPY